MWYGACGFWHSVASTANVLGNTGGIIMDHEAMSAVESRTRAFYESDPVFVRLQYEIRAAYEEGWRDGGGDPISSPHEKSACGWRASWLKSKARRFLVANGINTGKVEWK